MQLLLRNYALQVVIAGVGAKDSPLSELLGCLPNSDCRYGGRLKVIKVVIQDRRECNVVWY